MLGRRSVVLALLVALGVVPATGAAAAPRRADLTVAATVAPATVSTAGGSAQLRVPVRNIGGAPAADATVRITLPAGIGLEGDSVAFADWTCAVAGPVWTCTHPGLVAGAAAETLTFPLTVAPGSDGVVRTIPVTVATSTREASTRNNRATAAVRLATPVPGDITVGLTAVPAEVVVGDRIELRVQVRNSGAGDGWAYVNVPLPDGVDFVSPSGTDGWDCNFGRDVETGVRSWGCSYTSGLAPGEAALPLLLFATLTTGTPGSVLPFSVTARPQEGEPDLDDNVARTQVTVVEPAVVSGVVWADHDGDGRRAADESGSGYRVGVWLVPLAPADGEPAEIPATVAADGTYRAAVKPGAYRVQVRLDNWVWADFTAADAGDSDIVTVDHQTYQVVGDSAALDLRGGTETVVDAGARYVS
ncbi:DUF11 domain-containing protein [Asanoa siamensis]|uniref:DUF11 domain-containing protein n=1 Tax=Asanoa siamensis TaxID=926357 RepID=A0ABQ4CUD6_9ACTN|nr:DUF11 domain-containing protein [Asanoa siamensis]GIF74467.1 hypothetical protein Asi02nite_39850 [Asanoa siamensis]